MKAWSHYYAFLWPPILDQILLICSSSWLIYVNRAALKLGSEYISANFQLQLSRVSNISKIHLLFGLICKSTSCSTDVHEKGVLFKYIIVVKPRAQVNTVHHLNYEKPFDRSFSAFHETSLFCFLFWWCLNVKTITL